MSFELYHKQSGRNGSNENIKIDGNGRIYIKKYHNLNGRYDLLWDEETHRIGIKTTEDGIRKLTKVAGGSVASIKSLLDRFGVVYPKTYPISWENDIYTIAVEVKH